jgi:hypothetical protein
MRIRVWGLLKPEFGTRDGKLRIRDKHFGSATLAGSYENLITMVPIT